MSKLGDIVVEVMNKQNQFEIDIGCNSMFQDIYDRLENKPNYYFENWKSSVIQRLQKDSRFMCNKTTSGLRGNKINIVELKEEYK